MRVLILSAAILASALAAPSMFHWPAVQWSSTNPGDIQAAAINAKVRAEDDARSLVDQARFSSEIANLQNSKAYWEAEDRKWKAEDRKWKANDAINSEHAKLDAYRAKFAADGYKVNNADGIAKFGAKSAVFIPPAPAVNTKPGIIAPDLKAYYSQPRSLWPAVQWSSITAETPTNPGDIQAASINAKVRAEDDARSLVDQARFSSDIANLQNGEAYWEAEDRKWQVYDAVNTAHAKLDGYTAKLAADGYRADADAIANFAGKSAIFIPPAPVLGPAVYTKPGIVAPDLKAYYSQPPAQQSEKQSKPQKEEFSADTVLIESAENSFKSSQPLDPEKTAEDYKKAIIEMYRIAEENNKKAAGEALKTADEGFKQYAEGFKALHFPSENLSVVAVKTGALPEKKGDVVASGILTSAPIAFAPTITYDPFYASLSYLKPTAYSASYAHLQNHILPTFYKTVC